MKVYKSRRMVNEHRIFARTNTINNENSQDQWMNNIRSNPEKAKKRQSTREERLSMNETRKMNNITIIPEDKRESVWW